MAKAGMRRPDPKDPHGTESNKKTHIPKNDVPPVPEIQGKAKTSGKPITSNAIPRNNNGNFDFKFDSGFEMSTAEILDFSAGADSY